MYSSSSSLTLDIRPQRVDMMDYHYWSSSSPLATPFRYENDSGFTNQIHNNRNPEPDLVDYLIYSNGENLPNFNPNNDLIIGHGNHANSTCNPIMGSSFLPSPASYCELTNLSCENQPSSSSKIVDGHSGYNGGYGVCNPNYNQESFGGNHEVSFSNECDSIGLAPLGESIAMFEDEEDSDSEKSDEELIIDSDPLEPVSEDLKCKVCGDKSTGRHYNAITCEGCKGFFRRAVVKRLYEQFICKSKSNPGQCEVTPKNRRRSCRKCRFDRCRQAKMNPNICSVKSGSDYVGMSNVQDKVENIYQILPSIFHESFSQFCLAREHQACKWRPNQSFQQPEPNAVAIEYLDFHMQICTCLISFVSKFEFFRHIDPNSMWKIICDVGHFVACIFIACFPTSTSPQSFDSKNCTLPVVPSCEDLKVILPDTETALMDSISSQLLLTSNDYIALAIFTVIIERCNKLDLKAPEILEPLRSLENKRRQEGGWRSLSELISYGQKVEDFLKNLTQKLWNILIMK